MNTVDKLRSDITDLSSFSAVREREYTRRRDELAAVLTEKKKELSKVRLQVSAAAIPPIMKEQEVAKRLWGFVFQGKIKRLTTRVVSADSQIRRLVADGRSVEQSRKTMSGVIARLRRTEKDISELDHPTEEIASRLSAISSKIAAIGRKKDAQAIISVARDIIACVDAWAAAGRLSRTGREDKSGRIWLPIPFSMTSQATALGAKQEHSLKGASRFYVEVGDPLAKFNSLLPHAFRETRPKLQFSSIRSGAHRQNLWSFMDSLSWDHIRNVNYSMTGRRCILCGKQSGNLVRKLEPDKPNKVGSVECHEVWNWTRPDPDIPVGVQSLERIMVVCFDCHMCFHDEIARGKALRIGDADLERQVQRYLVKRRSFLTHSSPKDVVLDMQAEQAKLASHRDVKTWIVDLSKLAKQDYMYGQTPTLLSNNPAGVKPGQVAGITFRDEQGIIHPAVNPERLYQEVAMKWITQPEPNYKVMGRR